MLHLRAMNRPTSPVSLLMFDIVNTQRQPDDNGSVRVTTCFFVHSTGHEGRDWYAGSKRLDACKSVSSFEDAKHVLAFSSSCRKLVDGARPVRVVKFDSRVLLRREEIYLNLNYSILQSIFCMVRQN
jgi:hypothetical protein